MPDFWRAIVTLPEKNAEQNEVSSKEMQVKAGSGGGGNPTATVPEPAMVTLLGLGLASLASRKQD